MRHTKRIALVFPPSPPHLARLLQGIADYAREVGNWLIEFTPDSGHASLLDLRGWNGNGAIAMVETQAQLRVARRLGRPVVNLSGTLRQANVPRVMIDHEAVGRLAAEHLLDCGLRRLGYYGPQDAWYSELRQRGFAQRAAGQGVECAVLRVSEQFGARRSWQSWRTPLTRWLRRLKPPIGILASTDFRAAMVVDACAQLGLRVPDDVAVVGVGNHEITCEFCPVPLSSVSRNGWKVGYEAAVLLDRLMAGQKPPSADVLIAPDGVVHRRSTDVCAVDDEHVSAVVRFIREHIERPFGVKQLLQLVPVSRRWLEHRFRQCLGVTPHEYLCRLRVQRAQQLLAGPQKLPLVEVTRACGFSSAKRFRLAFQRHTGLSPADYRRSLPDRP
jgi:LacI family transcriptional regulator